MWILNEKHLGWWECGVKQNVCFKREPIKQKDSIWRSVGEKTIK